MKTLLAVVLALVLTLCTATLGQVPQRISYQGLLTDSSGAPLAAGNYNLKFEIYTSSQGGLLRHSETFGGVAVKRGTFSVLLGTITPFTFAFNESLFVEVTALAGPGIASSLTFSPRTPLTSAPYALQSLSLLGPNSIASGTGASAGGSFSRARGNYSVVSGGGGSPSDSNSAIGDYSAIGGGRINSARAYSATVAGGEGNNASGFIATIGGGATNRASNDMSTIGGGWLNVSSGLRSTVAGGEVDTASGDGSAVGGGTRNIASGGYSTVSGGYGNSAIWHNATIGGGGGNSATNNFATVGGGNGNAATGYSATVGGGGVDSASGFYATVPGGVFNTAAGAFSFSAGRKAKAYHDGSFVWGDQTDADFASTGVNQFLLRAGGGVGIETNNPLGQLHVETQNDNSPSSIASWDKRHVVFGGGGNSGGVGISYDQTNNQGYIEALSPNTIWRNLILQSGGGNVGIGTNTPEYPLTFGNSGGDKISLWSNDGTGTYYGLGLGSYQLEIHTDAAEADIVFGYGKSNSLTEVMRVKGIGNVGIGTSSPQQQLSVANALNIDQSNLNNGSVANALTFGSSSGEGIASKRTASGNQYGLDFYTASAPRLSILNNGYVGIGTGSPQSLLHVAGSIKADSYTKLGSDAPAIRMKKLTGTTSSFQGGGVFVVHGLTDSKIVAINVMVEWSQDLYVPAGYRNTTGREFYWENDVGGKITVWNFNGNSASLLSKPFKVLIIYEE